MLLGKHINADQNVQHWTRICQAQDQSRWPKRSIMPKTDVAFLAYSSGTTGQPKGVRLSHYNITSNILQISLADGNATWDGSKSVAGIQDAPPGKGDKILACLPFYHIYGLNLHIHGATYSGVTTFILARFDLEKWCRLVQTHQITYAFIVPPIVLLLCKHPVVDKYDLSSLRMTMSGAAPLTKDLVESLYKRKRVRVKQGYGLSETSPTIFIQRWEDWFRTVGSTGWLVANMQAKFCAVSDTENDSRQGEEVSPGEQGELYVKGPNIFLGYHKNDTATAECLEDGWFRTGDVGFITKDGSLVITDRIKELIKYKGFQVAPAELEGYLTGHELVDDVAVVGVKSTALDTEVPRAYIVRKGGLCAVQHNDARDIIQWLDERVAKYKRLRGGVKFVNAVPKSASGKILRRTLKSRATKEFGEEEKSIIDSRYEAKL